MLRVTSSLASALTNILLLGGIAAAWPRIGECDYGLCFVAEPEPFVTIDLWRPYIDNPGIVERADPAPECPAPQATRDRYDLAAAPLPVAWDPNARGNLYACVLVAGGGRVLDARILRGSGRAALDRELVGTIRRDWRFRALASEAEAASWQRVRLNAGAANGIVWDPPLLF